MNVDGLKSVIAEDKLFFHEPMKNHTTFRVGGPADVLVVPEDAQDISNVVRFAKENDISYFILGNGSNLLVADDGMDGIVLQIYKNLSGVGVQDHQLTIKAGTLLSQVAKVALDQGLTGFEFAGGIPGTFGGAVVMNAGAYGGEMVQVLKEVTLLTKDGDIKTLPAAELDLGYRTSNVIDNGYIVLEGVIELTPGDKDQIKAQMDEYATARKTKQPLEYPSAGSTFKRPQGHFAGKLVEDAGLRGYQVGGAQVSEKHCGFVVNKGDATAADIMQLMEDVKTMVNEKFGVILEPEVKRVGRF